MLTFGTRAHPLPESDTFGHLQDGRIVRRETEEREEKLNYLFFFTSVHKHALMTYTFIWCINLYIDSVYTYTVQCFPRKNIFHLFHSLTQIFAREVKYRKSFFIVFILVMAYNSGLFFIFIRKFQKF